MAFTIPNVTLPVPTDSNLNGLRNPTYVEGYVAIMSNTTAAGPASSGTGVNNTAVDRLGFFIDNSQATGNSLVVTATSTSTQFGASVLNTSYRGGFFSVDFTSVVATCTVKILLQSKDPGGYFYTVASMSVDNVSTGQGSVGAPHANNALLIVYPGATGGSNNTTIGEPLPGIFRTIASITVINLTTTSAVAFTLGYNLQL